MSEPKITGIVVDGVVYTINKSELKCACESCDLINECEKSLEIHDFCCYHFFPNESFKKQEATQNKEQKND